MSIDVVLVRARESGPEASRAVAEAIAARYGVPVAALLQRMTAGSFRVKSGADQETAHRYRKDLESMGAVCELRDSSTGELWRDPREAPSGLAAASGTFAQDLGALGEGSLALSTLDGGSGDTEPPPIAAYNLATPPAGMPALPEEGALVLASEAELTLASVDSSPEPAQRDSGNMFAPPSSDAAEEELTLAVDSRIPTPGHEDEPPPMRTMAPEPGEFSMTDDTSSSASSRRASGPRGPSLGERFSTLVDDGRRALARRSRGAFVAGAAAALLVGFLAAHVVGVFQETNAYSSVRKELLVSYSDATDPDSHAALGSLRDGAQNLIDSRQRKIAITGMLVWLVFAAGVAALWFRVIPWERLEAGAGGSGPPRANQQPAQPAAGSSGSSGSSSGGGSSP